MEEGKDDTENVPEQDEEREEGGEQKEEEEPEGSSAAAGSIIGSCTEVEGGRDATTSIIMAGETDSISIFA